MATLDSTIDDLYQRPLTEFVASRTALAKTLSGADAQRIRHLAKPSVVAWAVNQLYWKARPLHDRLMKQGQQLRAAQIAALKGRAEDLRRATEAHHTALAAAVQKATELAAAAGSHPSADALARTLEALSVAAKGPDSPGRLTEAIQPAGFEALSGIVPARLRGVEPHRRDGAASLKLVPGKRKDEGKAASAKSQSMMKLRAAEERRRMREEAARQRKAKATIASAERELARAQTDETRARRAFDAARARTETAEQKLATARIHIQGGR